MRGNFVSPGGVDLIGEGDNGNFGARLEGGVDAGELVQISCMVPNAERAFTWQAWKLAALEKLGVLVGEQELAAGERKVGVEAVPEDGDEASDAALGEAAGALSDARVGGPEKDRIGRDTCQCACVGATIYYFSHLRKRSSCFLVTTGSSVVGMSVCSRRLATSCNERWLVESSESCTNGTRLVGAKGKGRCVCV